MENEHFSDNKICRSESEHLAYLPMSQEDGQAICQWVYPAPYSCYNWPSWDEINKQQREFADPDIRAMQYFSVKTKEKKLIAFFQLFPLLDTIRVGLFVHPSFVNKGIGKAVCMLAVEAAKTHFTQPNIDLEVASWNTRAIHVYKQCGFEITDEYKLYNRALNKEESVYNMVYTK